MASKSMKRATLETHRWTITNAKMPSTSTVMMRAIRASLRPGMCGNVATSGVEPLLPLASPILLQSPPPGKLKLKLCVAASPVARPSIASRHQRDHQMGCNRMLSVRETAGRTQSTAESGCKGISVIGCCATYAEKLRASIKYADERTQREVSVCGLCVYFLFCRERWSRMRPPLVKRRERLLANQRMALFFVTNLFADVLG